MPTEIHSTVYCIQSTLKCITCHEASARVHDRTSAMCWATNPEIHVLAQKAYRLSPFTRTRHPGTNLEPRHVSSGEKKKRENTDSPLKSRRPTVTRLVECQTWLLTANLQQDGRYADNAPNLPPIGLELARGSGPNGSSRIFSFLSLFQCLILGRNILNEEMLFRANHLHVSSI